MIRNKTSLVRVRALISHASLQVRIPRRAPARVGAKGSWNVHVDPRRWARAEKWAENFTEHAHRLVVGGVRKLMRGWMTNERGWKSV